MSKIRKQRRLPKGVDLNKPATEKPPPPPPPSPPPPTHILLTLDVANKMLMQLGEVPHKYGPESIAHALRNARTVTLPAVP